MQPIKVMVKAYRDEYVLWFISHDKMNGWSNIYRHPSEDGSFEITASSADKDAAANLLSELRAEASMRAALLALANMELPIEVLQAATRASEEGSATEFLDNLFEAMLRAIIDEPK